jgi:hypothetical protein
MYVKERIKLLDVQKSHRELLLPGPVYHGFCWQRYDESKNREMTFRFSLVWFLTVDAAFQ